MTDDASSYWVGPAEDPDRFRLTVLLGSGGEGEVWRAVQVGSDQEVAIKIDRVPAGGQDGWEKRIGGLTSLGIKGLVTVKDAFVGVARHRLDDVLDDTPTHRYVVMEHVDGHTLRSWLDEHPGAPARQRIRILRGVARTLSALHRGTRGRDPITHGDVKPSNVIIGADGRPVLVDLGLLRPVGSGPVSGHTAAYSSPELRNPDAQPSPRADTFSFAVTAMETLTALTPPLGPDGNLDLESTRERIARSRALRARPFLRRQLLRSLTEEPERRPGTPIRVFTGRVVALVLAALLLVSGAGGTAIALQSEEGASPPVAVKQPEPVDPVGPTSIVSPPTASPSPKKTPKKDKKTVAAKPGNFITWDWGGGTSLQVGNAVRPRCRPYVSNVVATSTRIGKAWGDESFSLTLGSKYDLEITRITRTQRQVDPPAELQQSFGINCPEGQPNVLPPSGCGDGAPPKVIPYRLETSYVANLNRDTLQEEQPSAKPFGIFHGNCVPPSVLNLLALNCSTNVDYSLVLEYRLADQPKVLYTQTITPLRLLGRSGPNTSFVTTLFGMGTTWSSPGSSVGPENCTGTAPRPDHPYRYLDREIARLLVTAVHQARLARDLSLAEGVARVAKRANNPNYTESVIARYCSLARAEQWRDTCGKPDPT